MLFMGIISVISPIFKFSMEVRKVIYTTNAIESLNSQRSVFPSDTSLLKHYIWQDLKQQRDGLQV